MDMSKQTGRDNHPASAVLPPSSTSALSRPPLAGGVASTQTRIRKAATKGSSSRVLQSHASAADSETQTLADELNYSQLINSSAAAARAADHHASTLSPHHPHTSRPATATFTDTTSSSIAVATAPSLSPSSSLPASPARMAAAGGSGSLNASTVSAGGDIHNISGVARIADLHPLEKSKIGNLLSELVAREKREKQLSDAKKELERTVAMVEKECQQRSHEAQELKSQYKHAMDLLQVYQQGGVKPAGEPALYSPSKVSGLTATAGISSSRLSGAATQTSPLPSRSATTPSITRLHELTERARAAALPINDVAALTSSPYRYIPSVATPVASAASAASVSSSSVLPSWNDYPGAVALGSAAAASNLVQPHLQHQQQRSFSAVIRDLTSSPFLPLPLPSYAIPSSRWATSATAISVGSHSVSTDEEHPRLSAQLPLPVASHAAPTGTEIGVMIEPYRSSTLRRIQNDYQSALEDATQSLPPEQRRKFQSQFNGEAEEKSADTEFTRPSRLRGVAADSSALSSSLPSRSSSVSSDRRDSIHSTVSSSQVSTPQRKTAQQRDHQQAPAGQRMSPQEKMERRMQQLEQALVQHGSIGVAANQTASLEQLQQQPIAPAQALQQHPVHPQMLSHGPPIQPLSLISLNNPSQANRPSLSQYFSSHPLTSDLTPLHARSIPFQPSVVHPVPPPAVPPSALPLIEDPNLANHILHRSVQLANSYAAQRQARVTAAQSVASVVSSVHSSTRTVQVAPEERLVPDSPFHDILKSNPADVSQFTPTTRKIHRLLAIQNPQMPASSQGPQPIAAGSAQEPGLAPQAQSNGRTSKAKSTAAAMLAKRKEELLAAEQRSLRHTSALQQQQRQQHQQRARELEQSHEETAALKADDTLELDAEDFSMQRPRSHTDESDSDIQAQKIVITSPSGKHVKQLQLGVHSNTPISIPPNSDSATPTPNAPPPAMISQRHISDVGPHPSSAASSRRSSQSSIAAKVPARKPSLPPQHPVKTTSPAETYVPPPFSYRAKPKQRREKRSAEDTSTLDHSTVTASTKPDEDTDESLIVGNAHISFTTPVIERGQALKDRTPDLSSGILTPAAEQVNSRVASVTPAAAAAAQTEEADDDEVWELFEVNSPVNVQQQPPPPHVRTPNTNVKAAAIKQQLASDRQLNGPVELAEDAEYSEAGVTSSLVYSHPAAFPQTIESDNVASLQARLDALRMKQLERELEEVMPKVLADLQKGQSQSHPPSEGSGHRLLEDSPPGTPGRYERALRNALQHTPLRGRMREAQQHDVALLDVIDHLQDSVSAIRRTARASHVFNPDLHAIAMASSRVYDEPDFSRF